MSHQDGIKCHTKNHVIFCKLIFLEKYCQRRHLSIFQCIYTMFCRVDYVKCRTVCSTLPSKALTGRRHHRKSMLDNVHDVLRLRHPILQRLVHDLFYLIVSSFLIHSPTTIHLSPEGYSKLSQWGKPDNCVWSLLCVSLVRGFRRINIIYFLQLLLSKLMWVLLTNTEEIFCSK